MNSFIEVLRSIPPPFNMIVWIMLIITVGSIVSSAFKQIRKFACHRQELEFKRELLDRGLSADEIDQVVRARGEATQSNRWPE